MDKRAGTAKMQAGYDQATLDPSHPGARANHLPMATNKVPSTRCLIVVYNPTGLYLGSEVVALPFAAHECRRDHPGVMRALNEALVRNGAAPADGIDAMRIEINPLWTPPYQR